MNSVESEVFAEVCDLTRENLRLREQVRVLREAGDEALNCLIGCCVPAGGCDDKTAILEAQSKLRAALEATK